MTRHSDRAAPPISYSTEWSIHTKASSAEIFWHEMRSIFQSAVAISGSLLVEFSFTFVPVAFIGHFSTPALAALCLGSMTANLTGISILRGLSSPLETMLPSAHTSGRSDLLALWTQRTMVVLLIAIIPILVVWLHMESIMLYLKQDQEIARLVGVYLRWFSLGLPGLVFREISRRYFQSQGYLFVHTQIMLIVASLNVLLHYILIWGPEPFNLGFIGAPISAAISWGLVPVISIIYGVFFVPDAAWHPISLEIFTNLGELIRLGMFSVAQVSSEWWTWEILIFAASFLGSVSTASQSVLTTLACVTWQVGAALSTAVGVRVGHHLGTMDHRRARGAANASILLVLMTSIFLSSSYMVFREPLARLLSNDPEVIVEVVSVIPLVALLQIVDGNACVTSGLMRAMGRQYTGALLNISGFYFLGIPSSIYLAFSWHWRLHGLWAGLILAISYCSVIGTVLCLKTDWPQEVEKVRNRCHGHRERAYTGCDTDVEMN
ncbi:hypothetical protein H2248_002210 [Termitomyces sp. 'cryptogamus']|nr:hypothetical protein H2248_002210 [Termitomyces sp. 'cryptogamus']